VSRLHASVQAATPEPIFLITEAQRFTLARQVARERQINCRPNLLAAQERLADPGRLEAGAPGAELLADVLFRRVPANIRRSL